MILYGQLINGNKVIAEAKVEKDTAGKQLRDVLEECLLQLCRDLDISVPIWLKKNTKEFAMYRKTSFYSEQFVESIKFDRFDIKME